MSRSAFLPPWPHRARAGWLSLPWALCLLAGLAGCSTPLPYQERPPGLDSARAAFAQRRLDGAALAGFLEANGGRLPAAGQGWDFESLALAAGWFSPEVAAAQARWSAALDRRAAGLVRPAVPLDLALEHHSTTDANRPSPWTLALGLELVLPSERRQQARQAQLDSTVTLARLDLAQAFWGARQRLRSAWLELAALERQRSQRSHELTLATRREAAMRQRADLGEAAPAEQRAAALTLLQAQAASAETAREWEAAQARLRIAAGLPADGPALPLRDLLPAGDTQAREAEAALSGPALTGEALDNRLDLRTAEARFIAADADLRWELAQQYPELALRPGYEWDQDDHRLRVGLAFPLALPHARRVEVGQAQAEREARARELLGRQEGVLQELAQAREALSDALAERSSQLAGLAAQRALRERVEADRAGGEADLLQVLDAEAAVLQQEGQLDQADQLIALRCAQLEDALQQPVALLAQRAASVQRAAPGGPLPGGGT